jgi:intraflagellar transport protein 172
MSKSQGKDNNEHKMFEKLLLIAHYNAIRSACSGNEQLEIVAAKLSISLLRHVDIIPADKAFYEAGKMCQVNLKSITLIDSDLLLFCFSKRLKWDNMAFMFFNRYIDLADAIDDENGELLDHADFVNTDIPFEINLPQKKYLSV